MVDSLTTMHLTKEALDELGHCTVKDAAEYLGVPPDAVQQLKQASDQKTVSVPKKVRCLRIRLCLLMVGCIHSDLFFFHLSRVCVRRASEASRTYPSK